MWEKKTCCADHQEKCDSRLPGLPAKFFPAHSQGWQRFGAVFIDTIPSPFTSVILAKQIRKNECWQIWCKVSGVTEPNKHLYESALYAPSLNIFSRNVNKVHLLNGTGFTSIPFKWKNLNLFSWDLSHIYTSGASQINIGQLQYINRQTKSIDFSHL